jgi:hypothetical protein
MFRTSLELNYVKRPFRPLYGWTQATPKSGFLDPTWNRSVPIYPGMVVTKTTGNNYTLLGAASDATKANQVPAGHIGQFVGGYGIDELLEAGINAIAVWVLGPDAEFEVLAPAFDVTQSWADPGDGTTVLVYASTGGSNQGQLVLSSDPNASGVPVARLIQVESSTSLIIAGLNGRVA